MTQFKSWRHWSKAQRQFDRPGPLRRLRYRIGVWLLKPHWLPLLQHYNRMQLPVNNPRTATEREHCTYISIGIKYAIGSTRWGRYK